jgi:opacity protein-like surface antigen
MRCLLVAFSLIASVTGAYSQEFELPTLRGTQSFLPAPGPACCSTWGGFYFGGQIGAGVASNDFRTTTQDLVAHELRQLTLEQEQQVSTWQVLGKADTRGASGGFFIGCNSPWESLILGAELNYSRTSFSSVAPMTPLSINTSAGGNNYNVNLSGGASMRITDTLTLRGRAGWDAGNFLPYAMIGVAAGRADVTRSATVTGQQNPTPPPDPNSCDPVASPPCIPFTFSESSVKNGAFIWGWSIGGGVDVMVMPHVFLRAEYEFIGFAPIWHISSVVQTGRVGVGFKSP